MGLRGELGEKLDRLLQTHLGGQAFYIQSHISYSRELHLQGTDEEQQMLAAMNHDEAIADHPSTLSSSLGWQHRGQGTLHCSHKSTDPYLTTVKPIILPLMTVRLYQGLVLSGIQLIFFLVVVQSCVSDLVWG